MLINIIALHSLACLLPGYVVKVCLDFEYYQRILIYRLNPVKLHGVIDSIAVIVIVHQYGGET